MQPASKKSSVVSILIGVAAGAAAGLLFGRRTAILTLPAVAFVKLLEMTVLPYVVVSIVSCIGRLNAAQARTLALRVGGVLALIWLIVIATTFLMPLMFPAQTSASFFSTTMVERREPFDFIEIYIPANPFHSLAFNTVPAVVFFSLLAGVALIAVESKAPLLQVLDSAAAVILQISRMVSKLTPLGLFAIVGNVTGTLDVAQLGRLQIYVIAYAATALVLTLVVLPGLIAAVTAVPARELLREIQAPLVTAFAAGDVFIVLPALMDTSRSLIARHLSAEAATVPEAIIPTTYNLPHSGKLLSISFILFAGWFADTQIALSHYPRLAVTSLLSLFGSTNAAMLFLLDTFHIPADTFQLYIATSVINSRFGGALAAMHTVTVAILGAAAMSATLRFNRAQAVKAVSIASMVLAATIGAGRFGFARLIGSDYHGDQVLTAMRVRNPLPYSLVRDAAPAIDDQQSVLESIRAKHTLRVGYLSDALPFAFTNARGELAGFDIELAHRLASELDVNLEFTEIERASLAAAVAAGRCDLVMSGVAITTERASQLLFSAPYLDETMGLLVPDYQRTRFSSWQSIAALDQPTIGVPDLPYFLRKLQERLPRARFDTIGSEDDILKIGTNLDAVAIPAERGSAWTLLHPQYTMLVPEGEVVKVPLAYPIARRDRDFATFIDVWIDLKRKDGTVQSAYDYWILGRTR